MKNSLVQAWVLGLIILALQVGLNQVVKPDLQSSIFYIYTPILTVFAFLIIWVCKKVQTIDNTKVGLTFAALSVLKLLFIATLLLIQSADLKENTNKWISVGHVFIPAIIFIVLETREAMRILKNLDN